MGIGPEILEVDILFWRKVQEFDCLVIGLKDFAT